MLPIAASQNLMYALHLYRYPIRITSFRHELASALPKGNKKDQTARNQAWSSQASHTIWSPSMMDAVLAAPSSASLHHGSQKPMLV